MFYYFLGCFKELLPVQISNKPQISSFLIAPCSSSRINLAETCLIPTSLVKMAWCES